MTRRLAVALLGLVWVGVGVIFLRTDESRGLLGAFWEDTRGWAWLAVGLFAVGVSIVGRTTCRATLIVMGGLAGERLASLIGVAFLIGRITDGLVLSMLAWTVVVLAVVMAASLPLTRTTRVG